MSSRRSAAVCPSIEVVGGPDRSPPRPLGERRVVIGRHHDATVRLEDPTVAPHHLLVAFDSPTSPSAPVTATFTVLASGSRTEIDGCPVADTAVAAIGSEPLRVHLGGSELAMFGTRAGEVAMPLTATRRVSPPGSGVIAERPFVPGESEPSPAVSLPEVPTWPSGPPTTALTGATVALVGAFVVSRFVGSMLFIAFAAVAAGAAGAVYAGGWALAWSRRRGVRRRWLDDLDQLDADLAAAQALARDAACRRSLGVEPAIRAVAASRTRDPGACGETPPRGLPGLWQSRPDERGRIEVVVGRGVRPWRPAVAGDVADVADVEPARGDRARGGGDERRLASMRDERLGVHRELADVPVTVTLAPGATVALDGEGRESVARAIVAQLAWNIGPVDLGIVVVTDRPDRWAWAGRLPHGRRDGAAESVIDVSDLIRRPQTMTDLAGGSGALLVVLDADRRADADSLIRRIAAGDDARVVVLAVAAEPPGWSDDVVTISASGSITVRSRRSGVPFRGRCIGVSAATASAIASIVEPLDDPEVVASSLPERCTLGEVHRWPGSDAPIDPFDAGAIDVGWRCGGSDPPPVATIGWSSAGPEMIDLDRDGPHALVAGTTGAGKSELLRTLVAGLAVRSSPEHLGLLLVDYKGGAAFDTCTALPHVAGVITDLDGGLAARALRSLEAEMLRREQLFRTVGAADLGAYRAAVHDLDEHDLAGHDLTGTEPIGRLVIVVDEFAALARELPEFLAALVDIGRRGRSLGVHLVLATQRPAGIVSDDLRANTGLRIALRVTTPAESSDVVAVPDAARIARALPGRAIRSADGGEVRHFQTASCTDPDGASDTELSVLVDAVRRASAVGGWGVPSPPWHPPLPGSIRPDELGSLLSDGRQRKPGRRGGSGDGSADGSADGSRGGALPIGVVDDPDRQRRLPLRWTPGDGSLALVGRVGVGATSTLLSIVSAALGTGRPDELHLYVIDALGDQRLDALAGVAHCGGVVRPSETERLRRLVARLADGSRADGCRTLLVVDGVESLRASLRDGEDTAIEREVIDLLMAAGDRGIDVVMSARSDLGVLRGAFRDLWVGALDDPTVARAAGWRAGEVDRFGPGRFGVVSNQLVAQVALGAPGLAELPGRTAGDGPRLVEALPEEVPRAELSRAGGGEPGRLRIGLAADTLLPDGPPLVPGAHLLVVGGPASGVTTALATIAAAWRAKHPTGRVIDVRDNSDLDHLRESLDGDAEGESLESEGGSVLVVVDGAAGIEDRDGLLAGVIGGGVGAGRVHLVAGVRADAVRQSFGHWSRQLAADGLGVALTRAGDPPTDVFGVPAPRRPLVAARLGLGWLVESGSVRALQIAR